MGKEHKKAIRATFRDAVFQRDGYACRYCGYQSTPEKAVAELDAHHVTPREDMEGGGYVPENGITLCCERTPGREQDNCHEKAEAYLVWIGFSDEYTGNGYDPEHLYSLIGSSYLQAHRASRELADGT